MKRADVAANHQIINFPSPSYVSHSKRNLPNISSLASTGIHATNAQFYNL